MIAIPGEEAPTDPGERARAMAELEEHAAKSKSRMPFIAAAAAFGIVIGGIGAAVFMNQPEEIATVELDDAIYIVPLDAHVDPVVEGEDGDAQANASTNKKSTRKSSRGSDSSSSSSASARQAALTRPPATGGTIAGGDAPVAEGSVLPRAGSGLDSPLSSLGPSVKRANLDGIILSDPGEINAMVKRVMSKGAGQLKHCYESRLKSKEDLKGAWNVQFQIGKEGRATRVGVVPMNASDPELEACISRNVEGWAFLKINEPLAVSKVYRFSGQ